MNENIIIHFILPQKVNLYFNYSLGFYAIFDKIAEEGEKSEGGTTSSKHC